MPHQNRNNGKWHWMFSHSQVSKLRSKVLERIMRSWKFVVKNVNECSPIVKNKIKCEHLVGYYVTTLA